MKLTSSTTEIFTQNLKQSHDFKVGDLQILFQILRDKLYKDPILAICREISCNARDAHREVGKFDVPIEIDLPTSFCPTLKIKDFGPGITDDRMDIFTGYGSSTKRNDNIQTGGFGLGAKTPFSYTDSFSIETIVPFFLRRRHKYKYKPKFTKLVKIKKFKRGLCCVGKFLKKKKIYSAYLDETKIGKISLLHQGITNEPNGTTIEIPIKETKDLSRFVRGIIDSTMFWDIKPKIINFDSLQDEFDINRTDYSFSPILYTEKYKIYALKSNALKQGVFGIIDGILYKIDISQLELQEEIKEFLQANLSFHFIFQIGELTLTASRDEIQYDELTIKLLTNIISSLILEIKSNLQQIIDSKTYFEARDFVDGINRYNYNYSYRYTSQFYWKGLPINHELQLQSFNVDSVYFSYSYGCNKYQNSKTIFTLPIKENNTIYLNDCYEHTAMPEFVIEEFKNRGILKFGYLSWPRKYEGDRSIDSLNSDWLKVLNIIPISSLNIVKPKISSIKSSNTNDYFKAFEIKNYIRGGYGLHLVNSNFLKSKSYYYFLTEDQKTVKINNKEISGNILTEIENYLDISRHEIVVLTSSKLDKLLKDKSITLINLLDLLKDKVQTDISRLNLSIEELLSYDSNFDFNVKFSNFMQIVDWCGLNLQNILNPNKQLGNYYFISKSYQDILSNESYLVDLVKLLYSDQQMGSVHILNVLYHEDWARYELLNLLNRPYHCDLDKQIIAKNLSEYLNILE